MPRVPPDAPMQPWQKGYPLARLKQLKRLFAGFDKGYVFGAFGGVKENTCAEWLAAGKLLLAEDRGGLLAAAVVTRQESARSVSGFSGPLGRPNKGACRVKRMACQAGAEGVLAALCDSPGELWLEGWAESPQVRLVARSLGAAWVGAKVTAASEIVGIFARGAGPLAPPAPYEEAALCQLSLRLPASLVAAAAREAQEAAPQMGQHYSAYNKAGSWQALALQGFGGKADFIIKPAEMSKEWKAEHPLEMRWPCCPTPLLAQLPACAKLAAAVPGAKERIRLMRLAPGGGELLRHADITDPEAGVQPGRLMRIHIPLVTNPGVRFTQWLLTGEKKQANMQVGSVWYLDTRKPHTAVNGGATERIHLVLDVHSTPGLLACLPNG